jgi:hypothetical protein
MIFVVCVGLAAGVGESLERDTSALVAEAKLFIASYISLTTFSKFSGLTPAGLLILKSSAIILLSS